MQLLWFSFQSFIYLFSNFITSCSWLSVEPLKCWNNPVYTFVLLDSQRSINYKPIKKICVHHFEFSSSAELINWKLTSSRLTVKRIYKDHWGFDLMVPVGAHSGAMAKGASHSHKCVRACLCGWPTCVCALFLVLLHPSQPTAATHCAIHG